MAFGFVRALGNALNAVPGAGWVGHELYQTGEDLTSSLVHMPGGIVYSLEHPTQVPGLFYNAIKQDLSHPLRHPGNTLLDALMLESAGGAVAGRLGEIGAIGARAGGLPEDLATATRDFAPGSAEAQTAARGIGKAAQYNRIIDTSSETGSLIPTSTQIANVMLRGPAPESRLLVKPGTMTPDNPEGLVQYGFQFSKDPLIRKAQRLIDAQYAKFPDGTPPPIWRIGGAPFFWRSQYGRIKSAQANELLYASRKSRADVRAALAKYGDLPDEVYVAQKLASEGRTVEGAAALAEKELASGTLTPTQVAESQHLLETLPKAKNYLDNVDVVSPVKNIDGTDRVFTVPRFKSPEELQSLHAAGVIHDPAVVNEFVNTMKGLSNEREETALMTGYLSADSRLKRLVGPAVYQATGHLPMTADQLRFEIRRLKNLKGESQARLAARYGRQLEEIEGQGKLFGEVHEPDIFLNDDERRWFAENNDLYYTPHEAQIRRGLGTRLNLQDVRMTRSYKGARKAPPSSFTHPFRAEIMRTGGGEVNTMRTMAHAYTEAMRYNQLRQIYDSLAVSARPTPEGIPPERRLMIVTNPYVKNMMNKEQALARTYGHGAPPVAIDPQIFAGGGELHDVAGTHSVLGGMKYEGIRQAVMPDLSVGFQELRRRIPDLTKEVYSKLVGNKEGKFQAVPGYGWIDERELGGLNKVNPLQGAYENKYVRAGFRTLDAINAGAKSMMTYLRPAYLLPNALGQIALNMVHTGFLFPYHLARSFVIWRGLNDVTKSHVLEHMGESKYGALAYEKEGRGVFRAIEQSNAWLARQYSKMIDRNSRIAAFMHEAAKAGFDSPERVEALVHDSKFSDSLKEISSRSNEEVLNYERLGPGEQAVMRRLILFYPFTKASARYLNLFYKQHPVAAGATGALGEKGEEEQKKFFPAGLPSWAENLIPLEGGFRPFGLNIPGLSANGLTTINPASISPIEPAPVLAQQVANIFHGTPMAAQDITGNLAPVDRFALAILSAGRVATLSHPPNEPVIVTAGNELQSSIPAIALIHQLMGQTGSGAPLAQSYYPDPRLSTALLRYFLTGGLQPRLTSAPKFTQSALRQEQPTGFVG